MRFWQSRLGRYKFYDIFGLLIFGSFFGLVFETLYMFMMHGEWFSRRGLLFLPLCPLYGLALAGSRLLPAFCQKNYIRLWLTGFFGGSLLEYVSSALLERIFHLRWWDYTYWPYNLNGRIWLPMSLVWGLVVVICNRWLSVGIIIGVRKLPAKITEVCFTLLLIMLIIDSSLTTIGIVRFANRHDIATGPAWLTNQAISKDSRWVTTLDRSLFSDQNMYRVFPYMAAEKPDGSWELVSIINSGK